ncbi:MAG: transglutaminase-like domain-containing protein [Lysobacteraceae bacterium]
MAFSTGTLSALNGVLADINMPNPLGSTALVESNAPVVRARALSVAGEGSDCVRAVRLHDHVRDQVPFGIARHYWRVPASRALEAPCLHGVPKAHLLCALLRAVNIPARLRFVSVDAGVFSGLLALPSPRIDHALVEVWLQERWVACDSFQMDAAAFERARAVLRAAGRTFGLGIHVDGRIEWTGSAPSFCLLVTGGPDALPPVLDLGVHADASALYAESRPGASPPSLATRLGWRMLAGGANRRLAELHAAAVAGTA